MGLVPLILCALSCCLSVSACAVLCVCVCCDFSIPSKFLLTCLLFSDCASPVCFTVLFRVAPVSIVLVCAIEPSEVVDVVWHDVLVSV